jgi:archaellum biogenesis ATPase FlaH
MFNSKIPSGIEPVDRLWNGLFRGTAYLLYGQARYGRNLLALHTARTGVERGESCIYVSPRRPRDLAVQAESLGFDIEAAVRSGKLRLLRVPSGLASGADEVVEAALGSLADFVASASPDRSIIEDFTPFIRTTDPQRLNESISRFIDHACSDGTTILFGLDEPGNGHSRATLDHLRHLTAGAVHIDFDDQASEASTRILTLLPLVGSMHPREVVNIDLASLSAPARTEGDYASVAGGEAIGRSGSDGSDWISEPPAGPEQPVDSGQQNPVPKAAYRVEDPVADEADPQEDFAGDGIHFLDIDDSWYASAPSEVTPLDDPFAHVTRRGSFLSAGEYTRFEVDSRSTAPNSAESAGPVQCWDEEQSLAGVASASEAAPETKMTEAAVELSREDFAWAFDRALSEWSMTGRPFLGLAIRLDSLHPVARTLPALLPLVRGLIGREDMITATEDGRRVALLLPGRTPEDARTLLVGLREELLASAPGGNKDVLGAVAALVLPNGEPFQAGASFVDHALDGK